jgi:hypothetical protein
MNETTTPAGSATGTDLDLDKTLDKMEVIVQVIEGERLPNTASALRRLIAAARRAPQPSADRAPADGAPGVDTLATYTFGDGFVYYRKNDVDRCIAVPPTAAPADGAPKLELAALLRFAGEAGFNVLGGSFVTPKHSGHLTEELERFAELVRAPTAGDSPSPQPDSRLQREYQRGRMDAIAEYQSTVDEIRRAALASPQPSVDEAASIKTWHERMDGGSFRVAGRTAWDPDKIYIGERAPLEARDAEIAELRAALTRRAPPAASKREIRPGEVFVVPPGVTVCQVAATTASASERRPLPPFRPWGPAYGPEEEAAGEAVKRAGLLNEVEMLCEAARRSEANTWGRQVKILAEAYETACKAAQQAVAQPVAPADAREGAAQAMAGEEARDAARYRFLRDGSWNNFTHPQIREHLMSHVNRSALDAALDDEINAQRASLAAPAPRNGGEND